MSEPHDLKQIIEHAAHLLPTQGPIGVFVHHNTLHALEHLPFEQAVVEAARLYGAEPYFSEERYRAEYAAGRIRGEDIEAVLADEPDAEVLGQLVTRRRLRLAMLVPGVRRFSADHIQWEIEENHLLERFRTDIAPETREFLMNRADEASSARSLFATCFRLTPPVVVEAAAPARPRDGLLFTGVDLDEVIHPWLIRLVSMYLDQGLAYWPMPGRELGFYRAAGQLLAQPFSLEPELLEGISAEFRAQQSLGLSAEQAIERSLKALGMRESDYARVIEAELLALPGWAGLMRRLEVEPELAPHQALACSLTDFLAVRLTLVAVAAQATWSRRSGREWSPGCWREMGAKRGDAAMEHLAEAARVFDVAQLLGISAEELQSFSSDEFGRLLGEIRAFGDWERRRVLHLAYERRHELEMLAPLAKHRREAGLQAVAGRAAAQVIFCIDEREESMRRALEEVAPGVETFGAAGFFGVAVNYRGLDDAHAAPFCPVVIKPQHAVVEKARGTDEQLGWRRQRRRRIWSQLAQTGYIGSRTLVRGWVGTMGFGLLSLFPLITRVLAPRAAGRLRGWLSERFLPEPRTELTLMRHDAASHELAEGQLLGFSPPEKAERVASVLRPAGLTRGLARLVVVLGHGSTSLNNPHESAHDCGACGGRRGGPNARLFAAMANRQEVRQLLVKMGIEIPADTWFVGGYHDTCSDAIEYFDDDAIPASHRDDFRWIAGALERARAANALERARRFEAARGARTAAEALCHVEERAEHLAEPRPEYGHCTNAVCVVGRRALTRGLFFDRRAFLVSYDATTDADDSQLGRLLAAAGPVCAGINLEYYFSVVDNERYGAGTKLPHNVTGLVGVMNGQSSDLRTGLPWQMVEIHEPVRLLLILETTPERALRALAPSAEVMRLVRNRWIRLATIDPVSGAVHVYREGGFVPFRAPEAELPEAASSADWYLGRMEHLPVARIVAQGAAR
jgi:uncharacterized protein YbcC (UPF0753/DUF2309 family)